MASAAPAYRSRERAQRSRASVSVVRGRRPEAGLSHDAIVAARVLIVMVVLFAIVGCVRVGLTSATVRTAIAAEDLTAQVSNMQSYGANLEVKESSLSNPAHLRSVATQELGMQAPLTTDVISLGGGAATLNEEGNLSLSMSLAYVAQG